MLILRLKTKYIVGYFHWFFCHKFRLNISQNSLFHQKQHEISFFSRLGLNSKEVHTQTPQTQSLSTDKEANSTSTSVESAL